MGFCIVLGLTPDTRYSLASTVIAGKFTPSVDIRTEKATQLPDPDFEDVKSIIDFPGFRFRWSVFFHCFPDLQ